LFDDDFMNDGLVEKQSPKPPSEKAKKSRPAKKVFKAMRLTPKLVRRKPPSS
jgi:hypothetical protein